MKGAATSNLKIFQTEVFSNGNNDDEPGYYIYPIKQNERTKNDARGYPKGKRTNDERC